MFRPQFGHPQANSEHIKRYNKVSTQWDPISFKRNGILMMADLRPKHVALTLSCRTTYIYIYIYIYICRTAPLTSRCCILYIIQQIYIQNILNMLHTLSFFSSKCRLLHNATFFGSCVIHILYTGCAKIKKKFRHQRVNAN